jgi:methylmalonyl-CoA/ethylmalonyl-CoA epimerase
MRVTGFDHVGVLLPSFDGIEALAALLGADLAPPHADAQLGLEARFMTIGGVRLEFLRPLRADSRVSQAIARGEAGVHHVAVTVPDADEAIAALHASGIPVRDDRPRPGVHGSRIAFAEVGAALLEFVEPAEDVA